MLNDSDFLKGMWNKIDAIEEAEKINQLVFERNKKIKQKRIKGYAYVMGISILLVLVCIYGDLEAIGIASFIAMGLVYFYENKNMKNTNEGVM